MPSDHLLRSHLTQRYGKNAIPAEMTIEDFPVSYDELEPYYDRFEKLCGISGKAGNLRGQNIEGGNVVRRPAPERISQQAAGADAWPARSWKAAARASAITRSRRRPPT